MISNSIDTSSSNSSSQLLDLLSVVSKPEVYAAKIAELDAKTAEYRKMIEAVGPVSEINAMRDEAKAALDNAKSALDAAKKEAAAIVSDAKVSA